MIKDKSFDALYFTLLLLTPIIFTMDIFTHLKGIITPLANMLLLTQIITKKKLRLDIRILTGFAVLCSLISVYTFYKQEDIYFVIALISYVLSLIIYTILFYLNKPYNMQRSLMISSILLIFSLYILNLIYDKLGALFPLTLIYIIIITILVQTSFLRLGYVSKTSYYFGFLGSICLLLSSSLLMIERFYLPVFQSEMVIQFLYCLGLYLIIKSVLKDHTNLIST